MLLVVNETSFNDTNFRRKQIKHDIGSSYVILKKVQFSGMARMWNAIFSTKHLFEENTILRRRQVCEMPSSVNSI